jgi:hypothetical protein
MSFFLTHAPKQGFIVGRFKMAYVVRILRAKALSEISHF